MTARIKFFEANYLEAAQLMAELRNYLSYQLTTDVEQNDHNQRLEINFQAMLTSCRLAECMSWLLTQRALNEGDLKRAEATQDDWRLSSHLLLQEDGWHAYGFLPHGLKSLIYRSKNLFARIERLDEQVALRLQTAI